VIGASKAGHGIDRVWEGWKAIKPASHPSHTLWKSLRDYHISTASTTRRGIQKQEQRPTPIPKSSPYHRKGLVTDVPGPKCNACSGTLNPTAGLVSLHQREAQRLLWQMFFGRTLRAGTGRVEVGGAETFVDTGRLMRIYLPLLIENLLPMRWTDLPTRLRSFHYRLLGPACAPPPHNPGNGEY
jgi:hypothetical protein